MGESAGFGIRYWEMEITRLREENGKLRAELDALLRERKVGESYLLHQKGKIEKLRAEVQRLRGALQWYADPLVYAIDDANGYYPDAHIPIFEDDGNRARLALQATESETSKPDLG